MRNIVSYAGWNENRKAIKKHKKWLTANEDIFLGRLLTVRIYYSLNILASIFTKKEKNIQIKWEYLQQESLTKKYGMVQKVVPYLFYVTLKCISVKPYSVKIRGVKKRLSAMCNDTTKNTPKQQ
jgi:hypothetical protein